MDDFTFFFCKVCSLGFSIPPCLVSKKDTGVSDFFFLESVEANAFSQPCNCTMRSFGISLSWLSDARQRRNLLPGIPATYQVKFDADNKNNSDM